jgi:hypothetical protein
MKRQALEPDERWAKKLKVTVARLDQHYTSSNFRDDYKKLQYWRKGLRGWQIISESVF